MQNTIYAHCSATQSQDITHLVPYLARMALLPFTAMTVCARRCLL